MGPKRATFRIALFVALLIMPMVPLAPARAIETVGTVVAVRGEAFAVNQQEESRRLALKSPIHLMDTLKTTQGRIQLMFQDATLITLGRNSEMEIKEFLWRPDQAYGAMTTRVKEGTFRVMGGAITRTAPQNVKTETPSATIGIRGSMYAGKVKDDTLTIVFQGGRGIYVMNSQGVVDITRPGFGTKVKGAGLAPSAPKRFTGEDLNDIEGALEMNGPKGKKATAPDDSQASQEPEEETQAPVTAHSGGKGTSETTTIIENVTATVSDNSQKTTAADVEPPPDEEPPPEEDPTPPAIVSLLGTLGFSGTFSTSVPVSGVYAYTGILEEEATGQENPMKGLVNWHSKRFLMTTEKTATGTSGANFIFGEVTPLGEMTNITIIGSGFDTLINRVTGFKGSSTFGHFYGANQEALGLTMSGTEVDIQDQSVQEAWSGNGAATFEETIPFSDTGTVTYAGFFFGLAEDMAGPDKNKRIFSNKDPSEFTMTVNRDNGTVSGFLSGTSFHHPDDKITGLQIGGSDVTASAFITDKDMIGVLSGTNVITTATGTAGLKEYGNFMVTAGEEMLSAHTRWGYWEIAYQEPDTGSDYHLHIPGAMWLTGERTPASVVEGLISTDFSGTYTGLARGIGIDANGMMQELANGKTNLSINFASTSTTAISGSLSFDQLVLNVTGTPGAVTNSGFSATVDGAAASRVNGAFYGPSAEGIGGNFNADMGEMKYHGIFAGDR
jgi:hypothetical protein